ncbi:hypothetical protein [uncultured Chitinophaga sp.]|uniref:Ig-like domain-containing protein n=1 Tax=uncultured Chitinophaga sp. TaxID=339340 RepID=UPI002618080E|nr:hypothetical protein [uncultured Chitinophaga sp.]
MYCPLVTVAQGPEAASKFYAQWTANARLTIQYEQVSICQGDSATLTATTSTPFPETLWYDAPAGGNLLHVGSRYTVSPGVSTVYYVVSELFADDRIRDSITVTVSPCQRQQAIGDASGFVTVPPKAVKLHLSSNTSSGELLLVGNEQWAGSRLSIHDIKGREMQHELLEDRRFRLSGQYTDGVYIVNVTTPQGKVMIGKVRLYQ